MDLIVLPASALLHSDASPFSLAQKAAPGNGLEDLFRKHDVAVLKLVVLVLLAVLDLGRVVRHFLSLNY